MRQEIQMIKIYGSPRSSARRCYWLMEELGLAYETVEVDFQKNEQKSPEYLKLNPNGRIPTMVDGEFVLWESIAINTYLAEKNNSDLCGVTLEERALVAQWNFWSAIHLYGPFEVLILQQYRKTPDSEATIAARAEIPEYLTILNNHLQNKEYMVGNHFTLADITAATVVIMSSFVNYDISSYQHIGAWVKRLSERPAFQKFAA